MKKKCILMLAILTTGFGFSAENSADYWVHGKSTEKESPLISELETNEANLSRLDKKTLLAAENLAAKNSHIYVRMNVMEPNVGKGKPLIPGIGIGYRKTMGSSALDISAQYSKGRGSFKGNSEFITLPKVSYFYYFSPNNKRSLYVGPAIALGRVKTSGGNRFDGLIPGASIGYELNHKASFLSFFQLDMSLPFVATKSKGAFPGLIAELAFGAGF